MTMQQTTEAAHHLPPAFIIRDLDKDPHSPQAKDFRICADERQLPSPGLTPDTSPRSGHDMPVGVLTRSTYDPNTHSSSSSIDNLHSRSISSASIKSATTFPFTNIFKWKRTASNSSSYGSTGLPSPQSDENMTEPFANFDTKMLQVKNLDKLGQSIRDHRSEYLATLESQLQEERKMRHLAEDRLTAVEEEITRLCTVVLPTDSGETGEAYFEAIMQSVRLAIDSYEQRTNHLEAQLEEKTSRFITECRERTNTDIDCTALRGQLSQAQAKLQEAHAVTLVEEKNARLVVENEDLQAQLAQARLEVTKVNGTFLQMTADSAEAELKRDAHQKSLREREDEERATLLQRVKDTEAQRDALRQVSRGLRQRLTIEVRKNTEKIKALVAIDQNIGGGKYSRSSSRLGSASSAESSLAHHRTVSMDKKKGEALNLIYARPKMERFVTANEIHRSSRVSL